MFQALIPLVTHTPSDVATSGWPWWTSSRLRMWTALRFGEVGRGSPEEVKTRTALEGFGMATTAREIMTPDPVYMRSSDSVLDAAKRKRMA